MDVIFSSPKIWLSSGCKIIQVSKTKERKEDTDTPFMDFQLHTQLYLLHHITSIWRWSPGSSSLPHISTGRGKSGGKSWHFSDRFFTILTLFHHTYLGPIISPMGHHFFTLVSSSQINMRGLRVPAVTTCYHQAPPRPGGIQFGARIKTWLGEGMNLGYFLRDPMDRK